MKRSLHLLLDFSGRLVYLAGTSLVIYLVGGGRLFIRQPVGILYLSLWNTWWIVTFLGRRSGRPTRYDSGRNWLVILSGLLAVPFLIVVPPLEYALYTGPLPRNGWLAWIGLVAFATGIVIQVLAMRQLGSFFTVRLGVQAGQQLVTTGVYRWIRHPGYFSYLLSITGIALTLSSLATLVFIVPILIFLKYRIASEEKMLIAEFGDAYWQYQHKTWRLIPFIY